MKFQYLLALVALLGATAMFIAPDPVVAQGPASLVPCGIGVGGDYTECTVCHLVSLGQNIMNFFVFASVVVATLLFVNAGVLYVFSPGNPGNISKGHRIFTNTLVGILIILSSWIVIDFVMRQLVNPELLQSGAPGGWGPWNEILCTDGPVGPEAPPLEPAPPLVQNPASDLCDTPEGHAQLAGMFNVPYPAREHPDLGNLVACVVRDPTVAGLIDNQPKYSTDREKPLCNYTRGANTCYTPEACSHSLHSCHYGGSTGTQGAMAADLNARDSSESGERALWTAVSRVVFACGGKIVSFATHPNHTHISLLSCDRS